MDTIQEPELSPYPFGFTEHDDRLHRQGVPDRDLLADLERLTHNANELAAIAEEQHRFVLEYADDETPAGNRAVAEILLADTLRDLQATRFEKRRRIAIYERTADHPLARHFPPRDRSLNDRIQAVKAAWPIDRFVEIVLGAELKPAGRNCLKCHCPLPGHEDRTPSFVVFGDGGSAKCFGCNRGGDVFDLTALAFAKERFYEQLEELEHLAGIEKRGRR